jgi:hypothetical protein
MLITNKNFLLLIEVLECPAGKNVKDIKWQPTKGKKD